jgi:hypothetical protein
MYVFIQRKTNSIVGYAQNRYNNYIQFLLKMEIQKPLLRS